MAVSFNSLPKLKSSLDQDYYDVAIFQFIGHVNSKKMLEPVPKGTSLISNLRRQ